MEGTDGTVCSWDLPAAVLRYTCGDRKSDLICRIEQRGMAGQLVPDCPQYGMGVLYTGAGYGDVVRVDEDGRAIGADWGKIPFLIIYRAFTQTHEKLQ